MNRYFTPRWLPRVLAVVGVAATLPLIGCKEFLSVTAPDIILQANSAASAIALHNGAVLRLAQAVTGTQGPDALFLFGGLLTDEWRSGDTFVQRNNQDERIWDPTNTFNAGPFRNVNRVRTQARAAIDGLRTYSPTPRTNIGRMFAFVAYVEVLLGEHYCNGIPLDSVAGSTVIYGTPLSDDSIFKLAIANADSALANLGGADSAQVANFAKVTKGRALVDRADFAGAAAAVATVPDTFHYDVTHSVNANVNQINALNNGAKRYTVADTEGVNGLNYVSARDPRIPTQLGKTTDLIFDSQYGFRILRQGIWGQTSPVKIASGIEARLIEAEVALQAGDATTWLNKLNAPRANAAFVPVPPDTSYRPVAGTTLAPLADPVAPDARARLMFRERAFWMFSTGHRLGDMRRQLRQSPYNTFFSVNTVYPIGPWFKGGNYGDAIQMSIPVEEQNNPNFHGCTNRDP